MKSAIAFHLAGLAVIALCTTPLAAADEVIFIRSGQVGGIPGAPGSAADGNCISSPSGAMPLATAPFTTTGLLASACIGAQPFVLQPVSSWVTALVGDPAAQWVHSDVDASNEGRPPRSVLYCYRFTVESPTVCHATIEFCWAVDDRLGDPTGGVNPGGVYLNGTSLGPAFSGGTYSSESTVSATVTALVNPGSNTLVIYQRDTLNIASGLIFSARVVVQDSSPCVPGPGDEIITVRTGQLGGAPVAPGSITDNATCLASAAPSMPFQTTAFAFSDPPAVCSVGTPAFAVQPIAGWVPGLSCDPDARWVHWWASSPTPAGSPPRSVIYCFPFDVTTLDICHAELTLCWAADDQLGDPAPGPNQVGAYLNGTPLSSAFSGGDFTYETTASQDVTSLLVPGPNTLVLYQRDTDAVVSGLIASATIQVTEKIPCEASVGTPYCGPAVAHSGGLSAMMRVVGSDCVVDNNVSLVAESLPVNQFGYFLVSANQGSIQPPMSQGVLCLGSNIGRYSGPGQVGFSGPEGRFSLAVDLTLLPVNPPVPVLPGQTWNFQCWFRDVPNTNNFTDAVSVVFH